MARIDFDDRPRARGDLARWYAAALDDQAASGLSVAEYADEIGVAAATLYQWRRRLALRSDEDRQTLPNPVGLVEVTVKSRSAPDDVAVFTVRLGRDRGIEVPHEFDDAELRRLVTVLESC